MQLCLYTELFWAFFLQLQRMYLVCVIVLQHDALLQWFNKPDISQII